MRGTRSLIGRSRRGDGSSPEEEPEDPTQQAADHDFVPIDEGVPGEPSGGRVARLCQRTADARWFQWSVVAAILGNAIVLGIQTYADEDSRVGGLLGDVDRAFLYLFSVEIAIRVLAYGRHPWRFLREPWNVFDLVVVGAGFVPSIGAGATVLRLVRVLRVARIVSVIPDLRIVLRGLLRSLAPIGAVSFLALLFFYLYGMVGWLLFHSQNPEEWGNIGRSMLTLFEVLTLEDWVDVMDRGMEIHPWSWLYFVSFVLVTVFIVLNIVIAVVINSVESARGEDPAFDEVAATSDPTSTDEADARLLTSIAEMRAALDDMERKASRTERPRTPPE